MLPIGWVVTPPNANSISIILSTTVADRKCQASFDSLLRSINRVNAESIGRTIKLLQLTLFPFPFG